MIKRSKTFAIVGGDQRQAHLANSLAARGEGYIIYTMFLEQDVKLSKKVVASDDIRAVLPQTDIAIFPLPLLGADGMVNTPLSARRVHFEECLDYLGPGAVLLAGKVPPEARQMADEREVTLIDYLAREEFAILNAVPTAEGAVEIALRERSTTLFGSTCLITGYGRISKVLARLLTAFGARVKVVARKYRDLAWIRVNGLEAVHISELPHHLQEADVLFNTAPALLLDEEKLSRLKRSCLLVDLASKPGGIDFDAAEALGLRTIWALSLPGKVAPVTAGEITLDTIFNILNEMGAL